MNKIAKVTIGLMIITIISKILGFGRELVLGSVYGASIYSDVYITSMNIPILIFDLIGMAIATTFIPLYYENEEKFGTNRAREFSSNILNLVLVVSLIISIICAICTEPIVKLFAMGFKEEEFKLTVQFTRIMLSGGIFICTKNLITSYLQAKESFLIPGLSGIPFNIIIIISILSSFKYGVYTLPIGTLIAMASQFIFQYPFAIKKGFKYKFKINIKDEYISQIIWLVLPVFIGISVNQINAMIDRTFASTLMEGAVSSLNYANKLNLFVMGLFITTLTAVIYPNLSKIYAEDDKSTFSYLVSKYVNIIIILVIPISVGAIILAQPIVKLLFERGAFDSRATVMTATSLAMYSIGMVAYGLRDILSKVFYSLKDTKTPMINGIVTIIINILFNFILIRKFGYQGLALGTSLSSIVCIVILFMSLKKKIIYFGQDKIINTSIKVVISSFIMGLSVYILYYKILVEISEGFIYEGISIFLSVGIGIIVYGIMNIILKIDESIYILNKFKNKINN
ncbi:MAG: murein biosynthesis integral membrane protein MurJ [Peptostreptococcaceae bacterium]